MDIVEPPTLTDEDRLVWRGRWLATPDEANRRKGVSVHCNECSGTGTMCPSCAPLAFEWATFHGLCNLKTFNGPSD